MLSSAIYGNQLELHDLLYEDTTNGESVESVMKYLGLENPKSITLPTSDNHKSEVGIGYHTVKYKGETKTILAVIVRGTNGTIEEWSSNFDIGDSATFSASPDWRKLDNHKGFDIAANRILDIVSKYIDENRENLNSSNLLYWVTGHSRGAAIANIIGAYLQDSDFPALTYTFAAPNTTLASNTDAYNSIFNIMIRSPKVGKSRLRQLNNACSLTTEYSL